MNQIEHDCKNCIHTGLCKFEQAYYEIQKDIIEKAYKYGTYEISIKPYEDCCTVFVPKHPQIKPRLDVAKSLENKINYEELIDEAISNIEHIVLTSDKNYQVIKDEEDFF